MAMPHKSHVALLALLCSGCVSGAPNAGEIDVDALPRLVAHEALRIGSVTDTSAGFSRIGQIAVSDDGSVFVVEPSERTVRWYDASGQLLRKIGRAGDGPGEFRSPGLIGVYGDTIWVADNSQRRVTLFDRGGTVLATIRAPRTQVEVAPGLMVMLAGSRYLREGRLGAVFAVMATAGGATQNSVLVPRLVFDTSGSVVDTLGYRTLVPFEARYKQVPIGAAQVSIPMVTDAPLDVESASSAFVVDRSAAPSSNSGVFQVRRVSFKGDTIYTRLFRYAPRQYPSSFADSLAQAFADGYASSQPVARDLLVAAAKANIDLPAFQPPVAQAISPNDDWLWLRREDNSAATNRWIIIAPDGRTVSRLELPSSVQIRWASREVLWAVVPDSMDVPWLVKYRLQAP